MSRARTRPKLPPVSEEVRHVSAMLAREVLAWPGVTSKLMFGFRALYRDGAVFAMLPDKRSLEVADSLAFKEGGEWKSFAVGDAGGALKALEKAYEDASGR
jgi:hypothetical protein